MNEKYRWRITDENVSQWRKDVLGYKHYTTEILLMKKEKSVTHSWRLCDRLCVPDATDEKKDYTIRSLWFPNDKDLQLSEVLYTVEQPAW